MEAPSIGESQPMTDDRQVHFETFVAEKIEEASAARIQTLTTIFDRVEKTVALRVGSAWTRRHYDGDLGLVVAPPNETSVSLVFVQSPDGNTAAADPRVFGGGPTDKHLIYEGLSRVAADGVLAGARTIHPAAFFSVWHPELIALRKDLGLPRHPAQIVVSRSGRVDFTSLLFNVPDVPVFVIGGALGLEQHASALRDRPWIRPIVVNGDTLRPAIDRLRVEHGIRRISAVGGRFTATRLVDDGLAHDIYLTTGPRGGGVPDTPWYSGAVLPPVSVTTRKEWTDAGSRIVFEHILIG